MNFNAICSDLPPVSEWTFVHQYPFSESCCTFQAKMPPLKPTVSIHSGVLERVALRVGRLVDERRVELNRHMVVQAQMLAYYPEKADAMVRHLEYAVTPLTAAFAVELFRRHLDLHVQYLTEETFHRYVFLMRILLAIAICDRQ